MSHVKVKALHGFEHNGRVRKGDFLQICLQDAHKLSASGLVELVRSEEDMKKKELLSVSPVGQASQEPIAKQSENGGKKKRRNRG